MNLTVNPAGVEEDYLAGLNECFGRWGGPAEFRWALRRPFGGEAPDLMTVEDGGQRIAGSAVSYRPLRVRGGPPLLIGIMTGSWTRPAARGKGCFTRIIEASLACVRARRGAALLAFVTEDNASCRRLAAAGAGLLPTRYLVTAPGAAAIEGAAGEGAVGPVEEVADAPAIWEALRAERELARRGETTFGYPDGPHLRDQLGRDGAARLVRVADLGHAVLDERTEFDRLNALFPAPGVDRLELVALLVRRALGRGRRAFLFESDVARAERAAAALALEARPGYLTAMVADGEALTRGLGLAAAPADLALADPASPAWLGPLSIDGGDRM